jgi:hypothetical protein
LGDGRGGSVGGASNGLEDSEELKPAADKDTCETFGEDTENIMLKHNIERGSTHIHTPPQIQC